MVDVSANCNPDTSPRSARMSRRAVVSAVPAMACAWALTSTVGLAASARFRPLPRKPLMFAGVDLNSIEAIDTHCHPSSERTQTETLSSYGQTFARHALPAPDFTGKAELVARTAPDYARHFDETPSTVGLRNYVARTYGIPATDSSIDAVIEANKGAFPAYYRDKMDYERIAAVLVQSSSIELVRPKLLVPEDRFDWTWSVAPLILPDWAREQKFRDVDAWAEAIEAIVAKCAANDCRGIKLVIAYFRPIAFSRPTRDEANDHFAKVMAANPIAYGDAPVKFPVYSDEAVTAAMWACQDFLFHRLFIKAAELGLPVIIHSAVAMATDLRADFNDPRGLYKTFTDPDIARAGTRFVLIHTGYPFHHHVASFLSQFPNVYADLSFYSHDPGVLEETLRAFLAVAPSTKIMHGSDWSNPEQIGYAVSNTRTVLRRVLDDYSTVYGWRAEDCLMMARNVLGQNARRVFRITR